MRDKEAGSMEVRFRLSEAGRDRQTRDSDLCKLFATCWCGARTSDTFPSAEAQRLPWWTATDSSSNCREQNRQR